MVEMGVKQGIFGPDANKEALVMKFQQHRNLMIKNFSNANDPKIILENYVGKYMNFKMSGNEKKEFDKVKMKPIPEFVLSIEPEELLKYQNIFPNDLKIEKVHQGFYLEL